MLSPTNGRHIKKYYDYLMLTILITELRSAKDRQITEKEYNEL